MSAAPPASTPGRSKLSLALALAGTLAVALALPGCQRDTPESLLASAKAYSARRDHKAAVVQLKSALQLDPQNIKIRLLLGTTLLDAGDPLAAGIELSKARDQGVPDEEVLPPLVRAMMLLGDTRKVTTLYGGLNLANKEGQASLKAAVASAWAAQGERVKTEESLALALKAVPTHTAANVLKARLIAGKGDLKQALELAEAIVAKDPNAFEAWHLLGELRAFSSPDRASAVEAFNKSIAIEPANVQAHLALIALRIRERNMVAAKEQAARLRAVLPRHPQMVFVDAQLAFHDGDMKRAREFSQALLKLAPNHVGVLQLAGAVEGELRSLVVAETHFVKALQINPNLPLARRNLAQTYLRLGQPVRAFEALKPLLDAGSPDAPARALAAEALLLLGDARGAEQLFLDAARLNPDDEKIRTALALTHLTRGDADRAFADLERIAAGSKNNYADLAIISARIKRNEYEGALKAIATLETKQAADKAADKTTAPNLLGRVHAQRKDWPAARAAFERALAADPGFFTATSNLAAIDLRENKPEAAIARFDAAIQTDPRNHLAFIGKAEVMIRRDAPFADVQKVLLEAINASPSEADPRLQLIEYGLKKRQFKETLVHAQQATAAIPNQPKVLDALGRAQAQSGDNLQAVSTFQRAANLDPGSPLPHVRLADLHKAEGKRAAAVASLKRALEIDPQLAEAQVGLVEMLVADRRPQEAVVIARQLQANTSTWAGYLLEASVHMRTKALDEAANVLRAGLKVHPDSADLAVRLHQALNTGGKQAEATRFADDWIRAHPKDSAVAYQLALGAITRNELPDAERRLRQIVERHPDHPLALNNLAWVLVVTGKPGAVPLAERAVARLPGHAGIIDTLAMALAAENQLPKALELQKKAVSMQPDDDGLRLNLAKIAAQSGDKVLARSELERITAKGPLAPMHGEATKLLKTL